MGREACWRGRYAAGASGWEVGVRLRLPLAGLVLGMVLLAVPAAAQSPPPSVWDGSITVMTHLDPQSEFNICQESTTTFDLAAGVTLDSVCIPTGMWAGLSLTSSGSARGSFGSAGLVLGAAYHLQGQIDAVDTLWGYGRAEFRDTVTVSGGPTGTTGFLSVSVTVDGSRALSPTARGVAAWASWSQFGTPLPEGTSTHVLNYPIRFGQASGVAFSLFANVMVVETRLPLGTPYSVDVNYLNTARMMSARILDANGDVVPDARLTSAGGVTYPGIAPTSENVDITPPSIIGQRSPAANANGWNNSVVTVTFQCADDISGLAPGSPPAPIAVSAQAADQSVTGTCTDRAGNSASATVSGINVDLLPPTLTVPSVRIVNATGPTGTNVSYVVAATDLLDPNPVYMCGPASGAIVPIGDATVNCTATDRAGNATTASFPVHVKSASEQLNDLWAGVINDSRLPASVKSGLAAKIQAALVQFDPANPRERRLVCASMSLFISLVQAQSGRQIEQVRADQLIAAAKRIREVLGC